MKNTVINTTLGLIALATMTFAAGGAQANHDTPQAYGQTWNERGHQPRQAQRASQQRLAQINARQAEQQNRIQNGLRTHALTQREFRALMAEQQRIRFLEREFTVDGFMSPFEFQKLDRALNVANRNIRIEKHDRQTRNSGYGNYRYFN